MASLSGFLSFKVKVDLHFRYRMSSNSQSNSELPPSTTTDQPINRPISIATNQFQSDHQQRSTEVEEIDVAQADQSDRSL